MNKQNREFLFGFFMLLVGSISLTEHAYTIMKNSFTWFPFIGLVISLYCTARGAYNLYKANS